MLTWFIFRSRLKLLICFSLVLHDSNYWNLLHDDLCIHIQFFPIYGSYLVTPLLSFPLCFSLFFISRVLLAAMLILALKPLQVSLLFYKIFKNVTYSILSRRQKKMLTIVSSQIWKLHNSSLKAFFIVELFLPIKYSWMEQVRH